MGTKTSVNRLDDETRYAYLQAMDIDCWEPRIGEQREDEQEEIRHEKVTVQAEEKLEIIDKNITFESDSLSASIEKAEQIEKEIDKFVEKSSFKTSEEFSAAQQQRGQDISRLASSAFLKLVNWTSHKLETENCKTLLIICRHQIDQPANSFATASSPSQFMLDYIQGFQSILGQNSSGINIRLAHLSEAGLGNSSVPMGKVLESTQPDIVLILGDETVAHLFGEDATVANKRGQLIELKNNFEAFVSYHPFSLIENSSLKSLAFDDLINLANYLSVPK